MVPGSLNMVDG